METLHYPIEIQDTENSMPVLKILLIDDDEDDFILIREILSQVEKVHFTIDWIPHFEEAIRALRQDYHDICLLDYRLGKYDGLDVLRKIYTAPISMPIIFLTGQGDYEVDTKAMKAGADDYLTKDDINPFILERSIRYAIDRKRSKTALEKAYREMEKTVLDRTSELAQANERIRARAEQIKHFALFVSHDLKNPAIGINGLTRRLFKDYSDLLDSKGKKICLQILHASEQIANLAENINAYITTKEMPIKYEALNLSEISRIIRDEFSTRIAKRGIEWSGPDGNPLIKADRLCILRALRNLADNAFKYGGDCLSRIAIKYRESGDYHIISMMDNGVGLIEGDSKKIFDLFFRGKSLKNTDGTGLGLAIVKEIAEQHGGEVWVEPVPNNGTTISLSILKGL